MQVKFRGHRIELGEIENALMLAADGKLETAVVAAKGDILAAYLKPKVWHSLHVKGIVKHLSRVRCARITCRFLGA
jgi:acyl-coenzyme A synthetase/AMP-(fatty) acid ligase